MIGKKIKACFFDLARMIEENSAHIANLQAYIRDAEGDIHKFHPAISEINESIDRYNLELENIAIAIINNPQAAQLEELYQLLMESRIPTLEDFLHRSSIFKSDVKDFQKAISKKSLIEKIDTLYRFCLNDCHQDIAKYLAVS